MTREEFERYAAIVKKGKVAELRQALGKLVLDVVKQSYLDGSLTIEQYTGYIEYYVEVLNHA